MEKDHGLDYILKHLLKKTEESRDVSWEGKAGCPAEDVPFASLWVGRHH